MQKLIKQVTRNFQQFKNFCKSKLSKNHSSQHLFLQDFLVCESTARKLGCSYLIGHGTSTNKWLNLHAIWFRICLCILLVIEIISLILSVKNQQVYMMIDNVLFIGMIFVIFFKIFTVFFHKQEEIIEVIESLEKYFPRSGNDQINYRAYKYLKALKILEKLYYVLFTILDLQFCLMPFIHQFYGYQNSINLKWELIISIYLPYDQLHPILYGSIWIMDAWIVVVASFPIICTDLLFASLMQCLSMNFDIISQKFIQLDASDDEAKAVKELKNLVDVHQRLIEISEKLEDIFCPLLLINAFGSIIALCTASFLSVYGISSYFIAKFFLVSLFLPLQIFTQCYFSQQLINSSTSIYSSVYNMRWYTRSVKFQRLTLQVMVRAQKAQTVTAWKFFDMSLESFQWIISTSYSYFSVLQGTYGS